MILFFLLIFNIQSTKPCDPAKHLSTLMAHTSLQVKSLFAEKNVTKLLDELSKHDIQCHRNTSGVYQSALLKSNKNLLRRLSQSDSDFKESSITSTMLFNYVFWGFPARVKDALQAEVNPNSIDSKKDTPIIYALDQYSDSIQSNNTQRAGKFKIIIQDLLHHGSIIYGNSRYNCPFAFATRHKLYDILQLFTEIHNRRIEKFSNYFIYHGYQKKDADTLALKLINSYPDLMGLSSQERNALVAKNFFVDRFDKHKYQDIDHSNHSPQQEPQDQ